MEYSLECQEIFTGTLSIKSRNSNTKKEKIRRTRTNEWLNCSTDKVTVLSSYKYKI